MSRKRFSSNPTWYLRRLIREARQASQALPYAKDYKRARDNLNRANFRLKAYLDTVDVVLIKLLKADP